MRNARHDVHIVPLVEPTCDCNVGRRFNVTLAPADYGSWQSARDTLMSEAKHGLRASLDSEMAALGTDATEESLAALKEKFQAKERDIEHGIDHTVHTFTAAYDLVRTFKPRISPPPLALTAPFLPHPLRLAVVQLPLAVSGPRRACVIGA